jgi:hypothetical protein
MVVRLRAGLLIKTLLLLVLFLYLTNDLWWWISYVLATKIYVATKAYADYRPVTVAWFILFVEIVMIFYITIRLYMRWDRKLAEREEARTLQKG